ncbi:helix-turn-helix domain-containing protein, partial [Amycolatopsis halotolerans]
TRRLKGDPARDGGAGAIKHSIAVPSRPSRLPGVQMAGFVGDTVDLVDLTVVPYPAVTLFVNLRERLLVNDVARGSVVAGLAPQGMRVRGQDIECMQIRLSPGVAHAVLGTDLSGEVVSLEDVWPTELPARLRALNSWNDRFALVEASLGKRYEAGRTVDPEIAFAWQRMDARHGQVRIEQLADETGWSRKRLWSRFRSQLGLSPKRAAQLVRFDHAVHRLAAGESPASVAADSGYVDQSHLHHEVKAFAGITPAAAANAPWLAVDEVAWSRPHCANG